MVEVIGSVRVAREGCTLRNVLVSRPADSKGPAVEILAGGASIHGVTVEGKGRPGMAIW